MQETGIALGNETHVLDELLELLCLIELHAHLPGWLAVLRVQGRVAGLERVGPSNPNRANTDVSRSGPAETSDG
jgi:hypothetical protein